MTYMTHRKANPNQEANRQTKGDIAHRKERPNRQKHP